MARPRKQTYTMKQYLDNVKEGYISNNASTQRNPAWKPIIDGLVVTILTDDYIPPIILAEEKSGRIVIVDGGSRTAAFRMICEGNYKIKSSVEDPIIKYKKMEKDEQGNTIWSEAEFDIRNKTFEQFPKELKKKFYEYQVETVIHECDSEKIAKYLRRYNIHTGMNANEKMFIYLPRFAEMVRKIANRQFFINYSNFSDIEKEKGMLERSISETVMCMFHLKDWSKQGKKISAYLDEKSSYEEFDKLNDNLSRLEKIITDDTKVVFNKKESFVFLTLFDKFTKLGINDEKFSEFLREFIQNLRSTEKNEKGQFFDEIDKNTSTKSKQVIIDKLNMLEELMMAFLHIEETQNNEIVSIDDNFTNTENESFIADVLNMDLKKVIDEMEVYNETLDSLTEKTIRDGSKLLNIENRKSLLALVAYSYKRDVDLDEWLEQYATKNNMYFSDQEKNFLHMKKDFMNYIEKNK